MLPKEVSFFSGGGALTAASLVPRGRCGGEDEGGAIPKRELKRNLGQHSDGGCDCVWVGLLHHTYGSFVFFPPLLYPGSSGVAITPSHSHLVEIFGANKITGSRVTCTWLDFAFHELTFFPQFFLSFAK